MPYAGHTMMEREVAELATMANAPDATFPFENRKVEFVAVGGAESHLSLGAWHDNVDLHGNLVSRDCGLFQINIPARLIGSGVEAGLRTSSNDSNEYLRVAVTNSRAAAALYAEPWFGRAHREWEPWVAYTSGWALYPEAWVWSHVVPDTWVATGRYLHKAIRGVANYHWVRGHLTLEKALEEAERLASIYGITKGALFVDPDNRAKGVQWHYPPKPTAPGTAADYPTKNDGRSYLSAYLEAKK